MTLRILLALLLAVGVAGCSTTKASHIETLQTRVSDLEEQLEERDEQIQNLEDEVADLSERLEGPTRIPRGSASEEVELKAERTGIIRVNVPTQKVQEALKAAGFYNGPVDGKIGDKTKSAIVEFQKANGLKVDGIVGRGTWAKLSDYAN